MSVSIAWLRFLFIVNVGAFVCGIFLPLLTVSKLVLIKNTFSVASGIRQLLLADQYFLFVVIALFSLAFPSVKLMSLGVCLFARNARQAYRVLAWTNVVGKWSMLDVFVVAVLVVAVKLAGLASVQMREGLYFFAASVILTMLITQALTQTIRLQDKNKGC